MKVNKSNESDFQTKNNNYKNYLKPLKRGEERDTTKVMRNKEELHVIIHRLKNHYNDLVKLKNNKTIKLNELKKRTKGLNKQIEDKLAFSDIDFPKEKISIEDYEKFKNSNETKDSIKNKIVKLISEKDQISDKYDRELEFKNRINNLIEVEKQSLADLHLHVLEMKEKIKTIKAAEKNLEKNCEEKIRKEKIFQTVKNELDKELIKLEDVTEFQTRNHKKMIEELKVKNDGNQKFMKEIDMKDINLDKEHKKNAEKILLEISKSKLIKSQNTEKEKHVIKLILGLDIIKRYFIDVSIAQKEINTESLLKSEDLRTFYSDKYNIKENFDSINSISGFNSENQGVTVNAGFISNTNIGQGAGLNLNLLKSTSDFSTAEKSVTNKCNITLKSLKDKFDNLDINYEKIFDLYTKILNKTNFFHNQMINFNYKQIALESRKELNLKRVKEIIIKNKKNIEGLKKFDKKFITLFNKFKNEIDSENLNEKNKKKIKNFNSSPIIFEEFYKKSKIYFSDMKSFNEFIRINLKRMKVDCTDANIKNILKEKYKIFKENIRSEKNFKMFNNKEYIIDLSKIIEAELSKENKKLEKIERVIENYPPSRKSNSIKKALTNNNSNIGNEEFIQNTFLPNDLNSLNNLNESDNNRDDLGIDNYNNDNINANNEKLNINLEEKIEKENEYENKKQNLEDELNINGNGNQYLDKDYENLNSNLNINVEGKVIEENFNLNKSDIIFQSQNNKSELIKEKDKNFHNNIEEKEKNNEIEIQKEKDIEKEIEKEESPKSQSISQSNRNSKFSSNIYIAPYSGWSLEVLEEEKKICLNKINNLSKYAGVAKYFKKQQNINNLRELEVTFEMTLFYFFENTDKFIDNIKLSKDVVDTFKIMFNMKNLNITEYEKKNSTVNTKEGNTI
jgi:hypothetical protein